MDNNSWVVCRALLQRSPLEEQETIARLLPEALPKALASREDPLSSSMTLEEQLFGVHSSWIAPLLRSYAESEIRLFLSALSSAQMSDLQKTLLLTNHLVLLAPLARQFLQQRLWQLLGGDAQLPLSCLPTSPLDPLFSLDCRELNRLIFLLGLRDIAFEMHQIIETAKLKKIQAALSDEERRFLKELLQKREPVVFKRVALGQWDGNRETLRKTVRGRGLNRLAKGASGQHEGVLWYLSHRMDKEMAGQFFKLNTPMTPSTAQETLLQQIAHAIAALYPKTPGASR